MSWTCPSVGLTNEPPQTHSPFGFGSVNTYTTREIAKTATKRAPIQVRCYTFSSVVVVDFPALPQNVLRGSLKYLLCVCKTTLFKEKGASIGR